MRKYSFIVSLIALALVISVLHGCDNRSQMEKDADAAAKKATRALK